MYSSPISIKPVIILFFILLGLPLIWWKCAGQVMPEGGPVDKTPPEIIGVYPEPNATNVDTDVIRFHFSKHVDQMSFQQALFISPVITDIDYVWRGRGVELRLHEPLRENTTYSITVGTGVVDLRERNRMSQAFTLAFSTGEEIDKGQISGQVFYKDPVGILIFAYQLKDSVMADTLNPSVTQPDYITQTGDKGVFRLPYLRLGTYRIIAVKDEFQNRLYDIGIDPVGVYTADIALSEENSTYDDVLIRMHKVDITEPFLARVAVPDKNRIVVRFSKPVDPASVLVESFDIVEQATDRRLVVNDLSIRRDNPAEVFLFTEQQADAEYLLTVTNIRDNHGNPLMEDSRSDTFRGNPDPSEVPLKVDYIHPRDNQQNVPVEEHLIVQFSTIVPKVSAESAFELVDTNEVLVSGNFRWEDETTFLFKPTNPLVGKMPYTVRINLLEIVQDEITDTLFISQFTSIDRDELGTITGTIECLENIGYTVRALKPGEWEEDSYSITIDKAGPYRLENVLQGEYTVWSYEDGELSGEYNYGEVFPFRGSAPFRFFPDTVRIRPRWTTDGVNFDFRKQEDVEIPEEDNEIPLE